MLNKLLFGSAALLLLGILAQQPIQLLLSKGQARSQPATVATLPTPSISTPATAPQQDAAEIAPELADVSLPGLYDASGKLDMAQVKLLLDFYLSDQDSLASRQGLTCQTLRQQAKPQDQAALQDLCERYFQYRTKWYEVAAGLQPNSQHVGQSDLQQALAQRENLQRNWFSAEEQAALFGRENAYDQWMQQRMQTPPEARAQLDSNMQQVSEAHQAEEIRQSEEAQRALQEDAAQLNTQLSCYNQHNTRNTQEIQTLCNLNAGQLMRIHNYLAIHP